MGMMGDGIHWGEAAWHHGIGVLAPLCYRSLDQETERGLENIYSVYR